jgi:hypothetical protein
MEQSHFKVGEIFTCIATHQTEYPEPIKLSAGELVSLGEHAPEENWKNWIWTVKSSGQGGWVPEQLIDIFESDSNLQQGVVKEDYSARELNVNIGDKVVKIKSINGWTWVKNLNTEEEGWIPDDIILG